MSKKKKKDRVADNILTLLDIWRHKRNFKTKNKMGGGDQNTSHQVEML